MRDQAEKISSVRIKAFMPSDLPTFREFSGNSLSDDQNKFNNVVAPLTWEKNPAAGTTGATMVGGVLAAGIIAALTHNESAVRYENEIRSLVPTFYSSLDQNIAGDELTRKLQALASEPHDIRVERFDVATPTKNSGTAIGGKAATLTISLEQMVPPDFSGLRMKMRAEARGAEGNLIFSQSFYYLPSMELPGQNLTERVAAWGANNSKLYRDELKRGIDALFGALNVVFLSYRSLPDEIKLASAKEALSKVQCYTRDYLVPIPPSAFDDGRLLAENNSGFKIVRLANNEILVFPNCQ